MRKTYLLSLFLFFSYAHPAYSAENDEDEITIVGGVTYIHKNTDFDVGGKGFKPEYISIDWSAVLAYRNYYARINIDQSIRDYTDINNTLDGSGFGIPENQIISLNREDFALTFGVGLSDNFSIFAGYKTGETSGVAGGQIYDPNPSMSLTLANLFIRNTQISFKEDGLFAGFSYNYFLEKSGTINLSIAYADLDGDVLFVEPTLGPSNILALTTQQTQGKNTGYSYSLSWTDEFSKDLNYTIGLNIIRYKFDAPLTTSGDSFDFNNNFTNISIGFSKFF